MVPEIRGARESEPPLPGVHHGRARGVVHGGTRGHRRRRRAQREPAHALADPAAVDAAAVLRVRHGDPVQHGAARGARARRRPPLAGVHGAHEACGSAFPEAHDEVSQEDPGARPATLDVPPDRARGTYY